MGDCLRSTEFREQWKFSSRKQCNSDSMTFSKMLTIVGDTSKER